MFYDFISLISICLGDIPHLVLSDFGCALATGSFLVNYTNDEVNLGGNLSLRAPEVYIFTFLNFFFYSEFYFFRRQFSDKKRNVGRYFIHISLYS